MLKIKDETFGLTKENYPATKKVANEWHMAVVKSKMVPGKYGAITIKVSK